MGYLKSIGTLFIYVATFLALVTFLPGLPPQAEFQEYSIITSRDIDIKIPKSPKNWLRNAQQIFVNEVVGPESFDSYNGELYTGVHGGYMIKLEEDRIVPIVKFGKKCDGIWEEYICGRPLGFKFDKKGNLYVVDTYYGIFKVNVATKAYKNIVNVTKPIDGVKPILPNSVDVAINGDLYWTDSSSEFPLYHGLYSTLSNPTGRLIRYNAAEKKNEVLLRNLGFANGVKLSDDESFVIVAETLTSRLVKYHLKGPKAGQHEILIEGLPGLPDNIHSDGHGGFLVTFVIDVNSNSPLLIQSLAPHPYLRKMVLRLAHLIEMPFELIDRYYPTIYVKKILHWWGSFLMVQVMDDLSRSSVLRFDASGNILNILQSDDTNMINGISSAYIHNDYLWLGSPWNNNIMRVPLKDVFPELAVSDEKPSIRAKSEKEPLKATASDANAERVKRDTASAATAKPVESKPTPKPITPPAASKPTPAPTTTMPKPTVASTTTTPKPTVAPTTTSKPTTVPKAAPKADKPITVDNNVQSPEAKRASKSANVEIKNNAKTNVKSPSPNVKSETNSKNAAKPSTKSGIKLEQDRSMKGQNARK